MGSFLPVARWLGGVMTGVAASTVIAFVVADATAGPTAKIDLWHSGWFLTAVVAIPVGVTAFLGASYRLWRLKSAIRNELETLLDRGQNLWAQSRDGTQPLPQVEAQAWIDEVRLWLVKRLDGSYRARFDSNAGISPRALTVQAAEDTPARRSVSASLDFRLQRLHEFLKEV